MRHLSFNPEKRGDSKLCSDVQISSNMREQPNTQKKLSVGSDI